MGLRDQRRFRRLHKSLRAFIIDIDQEADVLPLDLMIGAETIDLSKQGLQVKTGCALAVGSYVMVVVYSEERKSVGFCRVMWKRADGRNFLYGLYFKEWCYLDSRITELLSESRKLLDFFRLKPKVTARVAA